MKEELTPEHLADLVMWSGFKQRAVEHVREVMAQVWEAGYLRGCDGPAASQREIDRSNPYTVKL